MPTYESMSHITHLASGSSKYCIISIRKDSKDYTDQLTTLLSEIIPIQPMSMLGQDKEVTETWKIHPYIKLAMAKDFPKNLFHIHQI